jgi:hypothetical protein
LAFVVWTLPSPSSVSKEGARRQVSTPFHLEYIEWTWLGVGTNVTVEAFTEFDEFYSGDFSPGNPNVLSSIIVS